MTRQPANTSLGETEDENVEFDPTLDLTTKPSNLQAAFDQFEDVWEHTYQQRWYSAVDHALNSPTGLSAIYAPPAVVSVIQTDGYKKWVDNPEYPTGRALADERAEEISKIRSERFRAMESVLLEYLGFILKCDAFRTMVAKPFASEDHVRTTLTQRCSDYWYNHFDQEFDEWLDQFFRDLNLSSVIQEDTQRYETAIADFVTFQQAISAARCISMTEGVQVIVERDAHKWTVFRPAASAPAHDGILYDHRDYDAFSSDEALDDLANDDDDKDTEDVRQEIIDEANDFADGLALSDSDGWFYPD